MRRTVFCIPALGSLHHGPPGTEGASAELVGPLPLTDDFLAPMKLSPENTAPPERSAGRPMGITGKAGEAACPASPWPPRQIPHSQAAGQYKPPRNKKGQMTRRTQEGRGLRWRTRGLGDTAVPLDADKGGAFLGKAPARPGCLGAGSSRLAEPARPHAAG